MGRFRKNGIKIFCIVQVAELECKPNSKLAHFFSRVVFILMCYCCCCFYYAIIIIILCHTVSQSVVFVFYSLAPFHRNNNIKFLYACIMANFSHFAVIQNTFFFPHLIFSYFPDAKQRSYLCMYIIMCTLAWNV